MGNIAISKNFNNALSFDDLKFMVAEFADQLENHLNEKVDIHLLTSTGPQGNIPRPTFKLGDLIFDFKIPGVVYLYQWDGTRLITFNLANFAGYINLITQGIGSGTNPALFLRSDGADHWVLDTPSGLDTASINIAVDIPAFTLVTANGEIADSSNIFHFGHVVGLSTVAVLSGFTDTVVAEGEVTNGSWSWTNNDKIFLNGTSLSTISPSTGFSQFIAIAKNNNTIYVRLQQPILL